MPTYEIVDDVYKSYGENPDGAQSGPAVAKVQIRGPLSVTPRGMIADPNDEPLMVDFFDGRLTVGDTPANVETIRLLNDAVARSEARGYPPGSIRVVGAEEMKVTITQAELDALRAENDELRKTQPRYDERHNTDPMHQPVVRMTPEEATQAAKDAGQFVCEVCGKTMAGGNIGALKTHCLWITRHGKAASKPKEHAVYLNELLREAASVA